MLVLGFSSLFFDMITATLLGCVLNLAEVGFSSLFFDMITAT